MTVPATVVDFGLTPEQEDHARELHAKIIVFDTLIECSWYDGLTPDPASNNRIHLTNYSPPLRGWACVLK